MTGFLIFIGVLNLGLGYAVGWFMAVDARCPDLGSLVAHYNPQPGELPERSLDVAIAPADRPITNEATPDGERPLTERVDERSSAKSTSATAGPWSGWTEQLTALKDRMRYARMTGDKGVALELAAQLRDCALSWCLQIQQHLDKSPTGTLAGGGIADTGEMCMAQLESALSNLESLEWNKWNVLPIVILSRLDRELESFESVVDSLESASRGDCPLAADEMTTPGADRSGAPHILSQSPKANTFACGTGA